MFTQGGEHESKTKHPAAPRRTGVGHSGSQYPPDRSAAYPAYLTLWNTLLSVLVFAVFQQAVFGKLVKKHTARIGALPNERLFFLRFFDRKSFV